MASASLRRASAAALVTITLACGLDESGILPLDASLGDVGAPDAPSDVAPDTLPQGCTTLEASACVDANVPDGWTLVAFAQSAATCPADFDQPSYVDNLKLEAGACTCGCLPAGRYSCAGPVQYGSNCGNCGGGVGGCSNKGTFDAGDNAVCFQSAFTSADIAFGPQPPATPVDVGCDASVSGQGFSGDPVTACVPHCTADYCGSLGSFKKCIVSTETSCPQPFQLMDTIGSPTAVSVTCAACTCSASQQGNCGASASYFTNTTSCGNTALGTASSLPSCNTTGATPVSSFRYTPTTPTVQCLPSPGDGGAAFAQPLTVCCL